MDNSKTQTKNTQELITPSVAIDILKDGNNRFVQSKMHARNLNQQVVDTSSGQFPFAAILSCIDSRVSAEHVFDQGIGDIFSVRIAGNFANQDIIASLEFSCKVAGSKLILVLGHTSCGAIKGACNHVELGNLTKMLENFNEPMDIASKNHEDCSVENKDFVYDVTKANVECTIDKILAESSVLKEMHDNKEIDVLGAIYDVSTGVVTFH